MRFAAPGALIVLLGLAVGVSPAAALSVMPVSEIAEPVTAGEETAAEPAPLPVVADREPAQPLTVLVLDVELAYAVSAWGRRAQSDIEAEARRIEAENTALEAQLTAEEQALTAERAALDPATFRQKAEAFDSRAQSIRRERAQVARDLRTRAQSDQSAFLDAALPIITALMQERHAGIVLDRRDALLAIAEVDITDDLVVRMDESVGAGSGLPELPETGAGQGVPAPDTGEVPAQSALPDAPAGTE
ncbi:MAG: OmpH family outer membrane protein [Paracoccus sp. (in: a-proteobacteria)]|nr:OmpH family outer membrane protein [Paracoccus sp. (in: a-proteobacteria)]